MLSHLLKTKQQSFQLTASPLERAAKPAIYRSILVSVLSLRAADSVLEPGSRQHLRVFLCFFHEKAGSCQLKLLGLCF